MNEIADMSGDHIYFAYHYLRKAEDADWDRLGSHLGTTWETADLRKILNAKSGASGQKSRVFVPLSLVVNPDLPKALLGEDKGNPSTGEGESPSVNNGDGLSTGMALPGDSHVVNMSDLDRGEFLGLIANAGLHTKK